MSTFFDSHCHFDFQAFDGRQVELWSQCNTLGVAGMVIPAVSPDCSRMFELAAQLAGVYGAVGLHPWWVADWLSSGRDAAQLKEVLLLSVKRDKCVAIGECGLDGLIDLPFDQQQAFFECQLEVADKCSMPVIVHVRKAHNQVLELLNKYDLKCGGVIHGFSGSYELAQQYWRLGFYLGVGGVITYPRAGKTRRAIAQMPLESLLLETDAPDMPLFGRQGVDNSPQWLPEIARVMAELKSVTVDEVARRTTNNVKKLFQLDIDK